MKESESALMSIHTVFGFPYPYRVFDASCPSVRFSLYKYGPPLSLICDSVESCNLWSLIYASLIPMLRV